MRIHQHSCSKETTFNHNSCLKPNFENGMETLSTTFAIVMVTAILILTVVSFWLARKVQRHDGNSTRYSLLVRECRTDTFFRVNYSSFYMLRRIFIVLNLMFLGNYPLLQILLFLTQSLAFSVYLFLHQPLEDRRTMNMELFNETMLLFAAQCLFVYTDFCS